ncbi:GNAT family N-acetyltransferase [Paenibacillus sp. YSY-4.3]
MSNEYNEMNKLKLAREIVDSTQQAVLPSFADAILSGNLPGQIHLERSGRSVLIGTPSGIYLAAGDEQSKEFRDLLLEVYKRRKETSSRFTLFSPSEQWSRAIATWFEDELRQLRRHSFQFNNDKYMARASVMGQENDAAGPFQWAKITAQSLAQSPNFNEAYILEYWGSVSRFLEHGFGYCLLHRDTVVSECISIFASPRYAEIDIATHPDYWGRGLAQRAAELFINHCLEHRLVPRWDCDISNAASIKLAEKLGFDNPRVYTIFASVRTSPKPPE